MLQRMEVATSREMVIRNLITIEVNIVWPTKHTVMQPTHAAVLKGN